MRSISSLVEMSCHLIVIVTTVLLCHQPSDQLPVPGGIPESLKQQMMEYAIKLEALRTRFEQQRSGVDKQKLAETNRLLNKGIEQADAIDSSKSMPDEDRKRILGQFGEAKQALEQLISSVSDGTAFDLGKLTGLVEELENSRKAVEQQLTGQRR